MSRVEVRRAEIVGALARAADLGMGRPIGQGLKSALLASRLAERLRFGAGERADVYWLSLLHHVGCTADQRIGALVFGDEIAARRWSAGVDTARPTEMLRALGRNIAVGESLPRRVLAWGRTLALMPRLFGTARATCEVAAQVAHSIGMPDRLSRALGTVFERWDGRGMPDRLAGPHIPRAVRAVQVAYEAELFRSVEGPAAARAALTARAGRALDPELAHACASSLDELTADPAGGSTWDEVMTREPSDLGPLDADALDRALAAMGDMSDLISPFFAGHSRAVAATVGEALLALGQPVDEARRGRRAAWVHDFGRIGISVTLWEKRGPLDDDDWERVRLHAYQTGRLLDRIPGLAEIARASAAAHERGDGTGYPGARSSDDPVARVLAAADVYCALIEPRAHRPAHSPAEAARMVDEEARRGRLDAVAVGAVLVAAGRPRARAAWPDRLTDREGEVLCLVARGLTNKEIASELGLSAKTVGNHLQNLFPKIGVTTRAAATLYATQRDLLAWSPRR